MAETIQTKRCSHCKDFKPLSDFNKNRTTRDGFQSDCKTCNRKYDKEYRQTKTGKATHHKADLCYQQTDKFKACQKRYFQSTKGKVAQKKYQKTTKGKAMLRAKTKRFYARNPNYSKAINAVNNAIRAGRLPRPDTLLCHYCPKPAEQYHHYLGYEPEHWLDVIPVCIPCHRNLPF